MKLLTIEDRDAPFVHAFKRSADHHGYTLVLSPPRVEGSAAFRRFKAAYQHYSVNAPSFELACFRRYFEAAEAAGSDARFIIADSDLLITSPVGLLPSPYRDFDGFVGSVGQVNGKQEVDISPHFSLWSRSAISSFVDFLIFMYEERPEDLADEYNRRLADGNKRAAISDMTLLARWVGTGAIPFFNSNMVVDGMHVDHNFSMSEASNAQFRTVGGFKRLVRSESGYSLIDRMGCLVRPVCLHLQGRAKVLARDLESGRLISASIKASAISLAKWARRHLS